MGSGDTKLNFIASYPKSGNTWVRILLGSAIEGDVAEGSDVRVEFYRDVCEIEPEELTHYQAAQIRGAAMLGMALAAEGQRTMIKTHHGFYEVERVPLFARAWTRKAIYIVRDPRDVAASMVHHFGMSESDAVEFMAYDAASIKGDKPNMPSLLLPWSQHVRSWTENRVVPTHVVQYEDLHENTEEALAGMLDFLEWEYTTDLEKVVELCAFDRLQKQEKEHGFIEKSKHADLFFRRGIVGSYRDELEPKTVRRIEADHGEAMAKWGYKPEMVLA